MSVRPTAPDALQQRRGDLFLIGGSRLLLSGMCLAVGFWLQQRTAPLLAEPVITGLLQGADLFLLGSLLLFGLLRIPLRVQTDWHIGFLTGALNSSDLGFLRLSKPLWLWGRAAAVRALAALLLLAAWMPSFGLLTAAKCIWAGLSPESESILPLLCVLHLLLLTAAALWLPLRVHAAKTALPFCFLKNPHRSAFFVLADALRRTKHRTGGIFKGRLLCQPLLLIPPVNMVVLPRLLAAEMLRAQDAGE